MRTKGPIGGTMRTMTGRKRTLGVTIENNGNKGRNNEWNDGNNRRNNREQ